MYLNQIKLIINKLNNNFKEDVPNSVTNIIL